MTTTPRANEHDGFLRWRRNCLVLDRSHLLAIIVHLQPIHIGNRTFRPRWNAAVSHQSCPLKLHHRPLPPGVQCNHRHYDWHSRRSDRYLRWNLLPCRSYHPRSPRGSLLVMSQRANHAQLPAVEPSARNRVNTVYTVATFCGMLMGTAVGNHLYA